MYKLRKIIIAALLFLAGSDLLFGQGNPYQGPEDPAGDDAAKREAWMDGNRIYLYYQNTTELSKWVGGVSDPLWSRWPNNDDGVRMLDGIGLLIGAKVFVVENDTIPVTDPVDIIDGDYDLTGQKLKTLYYLQTSYREEMDAAPAGFPLWGIYPVFGYFNPISETPALSDDSLSWPIGGWPSTGYAKKWPGEWNGRFGRGVQYADKETYFVANDAQDQENLGLEDQTKYYPRPGVKIGDYVVEQSTIQNGLPWGGIGVRVEQRGFQWNNPQARDAIFWEYSIANISDYDLTQVAFGYWVDNGIGGERDDEIGYFDVDVDMAYSWDNDGIGLGGLVTGTMGFAYLESPGISADYLDNDNDGLTDEKRNNPAGSIIDATAGITDLSRFLEVYKLTIDDLVPHYEGDEDQDWQNGIDLNGNGTYVMDIGTNGHEVWILEPGEDAADDVGLDGVGPTELNYDGPDEGEGNGKPDYQQGVGSEPNFNATDVTESDMVGLTSFRLFPVPSHSSSKWWFRGDESMWELVGQDSLEEFSGTVTNLVEVFASGPFPLKQGTEERISMSELHSYDGVEGLTESYSAPALFRQKEIVQIIYEKDYRFAQPPKMPTLSATAGDEQVILTWDDIADTKTREPILHNINDFEGYKLIRATDKNMSDAQVITDIYGNPKYLKPIFQCDLKDGKSGFTNFGMIDGVGYYLGEETGITHHYVDHNVQNGRTYYYALIAFDYGAPDILPGIAPSENTISIRKDEKDNIVGYGQNVQIVVPHQPAAGYTPPSVEQQEADDLMGQGTITPEIIARKDLKPDHTYKIKFSIDSIQVKTGVENGLLYSNNGIFVYDVTSGTDALVYSETENHYAYSNLQLVKEDTPNQADSLIYRAFRTDREINTDVFDGLRLKMKFDNSRPVPDYVNSGWIQGSSPINVAMAASDVAYFPWDYDIVFTADDSVTIGKLNNKSIPDINNVSINRRRLIFQKAFPFYIQNVTFGTDTSGAYPKLDLVIYDVNDNDIYEPLTDLVYGGVLDAAGNWVSTVCRINFSALSDSTQLPVAGDSYHFTYARPFWTTDSLMFTVKGEGELALDELNSVMDEIKVVPNPYVATNAFEPSLRSSSLNQQRRIMFIHLPAQCTIKIFTSSGMLVDRIDVDNTADNGTAFWDLLSSEGLEVAAGIYIYHIEATRTGKEKLGKFAIVK